MRNSVDVVIGLQHGDEGKGRFIDGLVEGGGYEWVARYNGGPNAGHTIEVGGQRLALHQVPSGVNHPHVNLYVGAGCVVNLLKLEQEIAEIEAAGIRVRHRLRLSAQAPVIQPSHILRDRVTMGGIGTTGNGIGPAYADEAARLDGTRRLDIRLGDFLTAPESAFSMIGRNLIAEGKRHNVPVDVELELAPLRAAVERLRGLIEPDPLVLIKAVRHDAHVLLEGAQAWGLDRTYGATPNVTSSHTGAASAFLGSGLPPDTLRHVYGVAKLTPSRVGYGPFPTELGGKRSEDYCMADGGKRHSREFEQATYGAHLDDMLASGDTFDVGVAMRMKGGEYGATTGRPRRLGLVDLPMLQQAVALNGVHRLLLTKADCLTDFSRTRWGGIPVAVGYRMGGKSIDYVPSTDLDQRQVTPQLSVLPPLTENVREARDLASLPPSLITLLATVQDKVGATVWQVGVGPARAEVIPVEGKLHWSQVQA